MYNVMKTTADNRDILIQVCDTLAEAQRVAKRYSFSYIIEVKA